MKQKTNILAKAGVLLIAVVMVLSALPAVAADTGEVTVDGVTTPQIKNVPSRINSGRTQFHTAILETSAPLGGVGVDEWYFRHISTAHDPTLASGSVGYGLATYTWYAGMTVDLSSEIGNSITKVAYLDYGDNTGQGFAMTVHIYEGSCSDSNPTLVHTQSIPPSTDSGVWEDIVLDTSVPINSAEYSVLFGITETVDSSYVMSRDLGPMHPDGGYISLSNGPNPTFPCDSLTSYGWSYNWNMECYVEEGGGPGPGPSGECLEDQCDFEIFGFSDEFDAMSTYDPELDAYFWNSLPKIVEINITNNGDIGISEIKILADIWEKVCGPTTGDCLPKYNLQDFYFELQNDSYWRDEFGNPEPFEYEGWISEDDLDDDSWVLQGGPDNRWLTDNQAWRCTLGEDRSLGGDVDAYLGKTDNPDANGLTDNLTTPGYDIAGAACASVSFSHWCEGEYTFDDDGFVVPIDYGRIEYSVDGGLHWAMVPISQFVAYDTADAWEPVTLKFINTAIDEDDEGYMHPYATICDDCQPEDGDILINVNFPEEAELKLKFVWDKDPCCQWEGWYIDDVCFTRTEDYNLIKVWQGHIITELDPCEIEEGPVFTIEDFPINWDPEPDTWYEIWIHGQVFSPMGCELITDNNWFKTQFKIVDIHDMACVNMDLITPADGTTTPGSSVTVNMTVQNLGTFTEANVPVELLVGDVVVDQVVNADFETDPTGMTRYNFNRGNGISHFHLTNGDPSISDIYTNDPIQARSLKPGNEAYICAEEGTYPFMIEDTMAYLEIDQIIDLDLNDNGEIDYGDPIDAYIDYFYKYSMEPSGSAVAVAVSLLEGPEDVTSYITWGYIDGTVTAPYYENDWVHERIDLTDLILDTVSYWETTYGYDFTGFPIPAANVGWIVFGSGPNVPWPGTSAVNGGVVNPTNPVAWTGFMMDRLRVNIASIDESSLETVMTANTGTIPPMGTETLELTWNNATLCYHGLVGDVNAPDDLVPSNDKCFETVKVLNEEKCFEGGSVDLTDAGDCLWHLCNNRPGGDDNFAWTGIEEETWCHYVNNMDESLVSPTINVSGFEADGVNVNFTHYLRLAAGDFGEMYVQSGGEWHKLETFAAGTGMGFKDVGVFIPEEYCEGGFFKIKFRFYSDDEFVSEGWFIDDIHIVDVTDDGVSGALAMWDLQFAYDAETAGGGLGVAGAEFDGTNFLANEWGYASNNVFQFAADGTYLGSWTPTWAGSSGLRDLAYDGTYFYGGTASTTIYQFDFDGNLIDTIASPTAVRAIAYDAGQDAFWVNNWGNDLVLVSRSGAQLDTIPNTVSIYGCAYDDLSVDGPYLWIFSGTTSGLGCQVEQYDISTKSLTGVTHSVSGDLGSDAIAGGLFFTADYEPGKLTLGGLAQMDPSTIFGYEVGEGSAGGDLVYGDIIETALTWLDQDTEDFERDDIDPWICDPSVGGNFWKRSSNNETLPNAEEGFDSDECEPCINGWYVIEGYSKDGTGLNNAYWLEIDLSDPLLVYAELEFAMDYDLKDEEIYIEFSPDWDPETEDMDEATWTIYWGRTPGSDAPFNGNTGGWKNISEFVDDDRFILEEYLGRVVHMRFRMVTAGNGAPVGAGWAIDGIALVVKRGDTPVFEDTEPPVTSFSFNEITKEVSLSATDYPLNKGSGVKEIKYTLDGVENTYTAPFTIPEGQSTIEYWAIDNANNVEGKNSVTLVVDTTAPTVELTSPEAGIYFLGNKILSFGSKAICIGKVPIAADADDGEGVGVARVLFDINGDTGYDDEAPYEYMFRGMNFGSLDISVKAIDNKGLESAPDTMTVTCFSLGLL